MRPVWTPGPIFYMGLVTAMAFWFVGPIILWRPCLRYEKLMRGHRDSLLQYI